MNPHWGERSLQIARRLLEDGFVIINEAADPASIAQLSAELEPIFASTGNCDGLFYGRRTRRIHGLLKRTHGTAPLVLDPLILTAAEHVLLPYCDRIQLNLTQAIEIGQGELAQAPHRDQDMWQRPAPGTEYLINVMWPLSPFTEENGATRLWPGTHRDLAIRRPMIGDCVAAVMGPGDALLYLGSTIHGAGANRSATPRRGLVVSYALGWLKQFENMMLTYPPELARTFPARLADLLGYRAHVGSLGSFDGRCPSEYLRGRWDPQSGARETMSAEHEAALEMFAQRQDWA